MSKLGEILRQLKNKPEEKASNAFVRKTAGKNRKVISFILFFLFFGSILLGLSLPKIFHYFFSSKKPQAKFSSLPTPNSPSSSPSSLSSPSLSSSPPSPSPSPSSTSQSQSQSQSQAPTIPKSSSFSKRKVATSLISPQKTKGETISSNKILLKELTPKKEAKETTISNEGLLLREPNLLNNLLLNAEEARKKGDLEEAKQFYETYLKYKNSAEVLNNLGGIYFLKGDFAKAEACFKKALSLKREEIYLLNLYLAKLKQGKKEEVCKEVLTKEFSPFLKEQIDIIIKLCK